MEILINQFVGFVIGILSSWFFWYLLLKAKPKIVVFSLAMYNPLTKNFLVKVRNNGRRQATDIQASLSIVEREVTGRLITLYFAKLRKDYLPALAPIQGLLEVWQLPATYVFVADNGNEILHHLKINENDIPSPNESSGLQRLQRANLSGVKKFRLFQKKHRESGGKDESNKSEIRAVFTLSATDGLSGTKVVQQITFGSDDLLKGKFALGFKVVEVKTVNKQQGSNKKEDDDDD